MHRNDSGRAAVIVTLFVVLVGLFLVISACSSYYDESTLTCHVTDKDRTSTSSGSSDMRVYTSDCGTLSVGDSLVKGKFRSADTYAKIEPGNDYEFTVYGWRNGFLSMFPTIIEVDSAN